MSFGDNLERAPLPLNVEYVLNVESTVGSLPQEDVTTKHVYFTLKNNNNYNRRTR